MAKRKKKEAVRDRCTGNCCRTFTLPYSPDELWASYDRWASATRNGDNTIDMSGNKPAIGSLTIGQDIHLIAPMVIYLGYQEQPFRRVVPEDEELLGKPRKKHHTYTCKHYDKKTGNCGIYEFRPRMCRSYPYGKSCNYAMCTWDSRKREKENLRKRRKSLLQIVEDPGDVMKAEPKEKK